MTIFEYIIYICLVLSLILFAFNKGNKSTLFIIVTTSTVVLTITTSIIMYKWAYIPVYAFILVLVLMSILETRKKKLIVFSLALLLFLSFAITITFPVYDIPKPSGDYLIGTKTFELTDDSRLELYSSEQEHRRFKIQLFYPTDSIDNLEQAYWLYDGVDVSRGLSKDTGFPYFFLDQTSNILSNSYIDASLSTKQDSYPVIILSHGWRGFRNLHQDFAEELASIGFIVVTIDHTYGSVATVFNDGVEYVNYDALPYREDESFLTKANQLVNTYASDIIYTIDFLETLNTSESIFNTHVNLDQIGLIGHSTGGGADTIVALTDNRVKSFIGLDPWVEPILGERIDDGLTIPSLILRSEQWETGENNINLSTLVTTSPYEPLIYQIQDTTHYDFAMVYMYSPFTKAINFSGDIDSSYLTLMLKDLITSFFNQTLINQNESITVNDSYPELIKVNFN
jgi:pimeloyl-ACP methyl ester carboxylesterase